MNNLGINVHFVFTDMPNWAENVLVDSLFICPNVLFFRDEQLTLVSKAKFPLAAKQLPTYLLTTLISCPHMWVCRAVLVKLLPPFHSQMAAVAYSHCSHSSLTGPAVVSNQVPSLAEEDSHRHASRQDSVA